ncbi:hypothetical protein QK911_07340 [Lactococcus lactis]
MTTTVYFGKNGGIDIELRGARKVLSLRKHIKIDPENLESVQLVSDMKKPKFYKKVAGTNAWYMAVGSEKTVKMSFGMSEIMSEF